jgi:hypothetical protein
MLRSGGTDVARLNLEGDAGNGSVELLQHQNRCDIRLARQGLNEDLHPDFSRRCFLRCGWFSDDGSL